MPALLAFLSSLGVTAFGRQILSWLSTEAWKIAWTAFMGYVDKIKQSFVNKENVKEYKQDIQTPTTEEQEIIDDGQDLLNGTRKP